MIKVNELRIGNWVWKVYAPYGSEQSREYAVVDIEEIKRASGVLGVNSFDHEPIPLTPEILEKCGAVLIEGNWKYQLSIGAIKMYFRFYAKLYSEVGGIYMGDRIQYLHQLQNLYHALLGSELEIKL